MNVILTKSAGFCYGANAAIDRVKEVLNTSEKIVYTTSHILHNKNVNDELARFGLKFVKSIDDIPDGATIILGAHGVTSDFIDRCIEKNLEIIDTTCKNVKNIYEIISEYQDEYKIIIVGDKEHKEVKGIASRIKGEYEIISSEDEVSKNKKICVVAQTTMNIEKFQDIVKKLTENAEEIVVKDTICRATYVRQEEAKKLAEMVDTFFIIGDKLSANSNRLYEVVKEKCSNTYFIFDENELKKEMIQGKDIGITAGASTPKDVINKVIERINEGI